MYTFDHESKKVGNLSFIIMDIKYYSHLNVNVKYRIKTIMSIIVLRIWFKRITYLRDQIDSVTLQGAL